MITLLIPHTTVTVVWFLLINVTFVSTDAVRAATRFELVIDEPYEYRNAAWPVTTGVPFPRGRLTSVEHCRLVDDRGLEQPVQARIAATWDRQRTSIHWLTINLVARPGHQYALEFGPDVDRQQFDSMLIVERSEPFRISTGAIRVGFSFRGPSALGEIRTALDGDGKIAAEEVIAAGANGGSQFWATYHRTLETTTLAYYLTGDERYKRRAQLLARSGRQNQCFH